MRKFLPWLDGERTKQMLACSITLRCFDSDENERASGVVTSGGVSMPPSSHRGLDTTRSIHQVFRGDSAHLNWELGRWKTLHMETGFCTMPHEQKNPVFAWENFWDSIQSFWLLCVGYGWASDQETPSNTKNKLVARIMTIYIYIYICVCVCVCVCV